MSTVRALTLCLVVVTPTFAADPFEQCRALGRGLNLGNWLEAPREGSWGVVIQQSDFTAIAEKGFSSLRIPIRWSGQGRVAVDSPYTVSDSFFQRVDWAIDNTLAAGMLAVINCHHYDELFAEPDLHRERFLAIWRQIAYRYRNHSDSLIFEILNEPHGQLTATRWNTLFAQALSIVREHNPTRTVVAGTAEWGGPESLATLSLPADTNLILTIHYYQPFTFTHQGASWVEGSQPWLGTTWEGDYFAKSAVQSDLRYVRLYSRENTIPVYVGEFGAYSAADMPSRVRWTRYCARLFESYGFAWAYWEYCSGFGIYDRSTDTWRNGLLDALIDDDTSVLEMETPPSGTDILTNGDFSRGTQGWTYGAWEGEAAGGVTEEIFTMEITDPATNSWEIQLFRTGLPIREGVRYALLFDAWSDTVRTIRAAIENATSYASYASVTPLLLSGEPETFSTAFTATATDTNARVSFSFGGHPATVYIDNVRLLVIDGTAAGDKPHRRRKRRIMIRPLRRGGLRIDHPSHKTGPLEVEIRDVRGRLCGSTTVEGGSAQEVVSTMHRAAGVHVAVLRARGSAPGEAMVRSGYVVIR
jgi:aryl-phospho-beta-D-glucosidase BglC (GH1 family)